MPDSFCVDVTTIRDRARRKATEGQLGDGDVTTRRLMEDILAEEEEHADDILDLLGS